MSRLGYSNLRMGEFIGLSTFQFLAFLRRSIFYGFVAVYLGVELGLSTVEVLLMATLGMIANTSSQALLWGNLLDRFKRSAMFVMLGEFIAGIGHIVMYFWHFQALKTGNKTYAGFTIIIGLAIIEIFWSQSNVGWSALISELTEENKRKKLMGQLSVIGGLGGITGATLGGFLYQGGMGFADGVLFIVPAIVMIISSFIVLMTIRDRSERLATNPVNKTDELSTKPIVKNYSLRDLPRETKIIFIIFLASLVFINFGRNSIALISSLYIVNDDAYGATDQQLALFRNVSSAATMVFGFFLGNILSEIKDTKVMTSGIISSMLALVWLIYAPTFDLVLIASFLIGAANVIIQASSYAIVAKIIPVEYRGRLFSYYNATFFLSWGIGGQLVAAPLADWLINEGYSEAFAYQMSFVSAIVMIVMGLLIYGVFLRRLNQVPKPTE